MTQTSLFKSLFSFHFITIFGILIALFVANISNEIRPLSTFLFSPSLYLLASGIAVTVRVILWLMMDKGSMFEAGRIIRQIIRDVITINIVVLSTISFVFLINTFVM